MMEIKRYTDGDRQEWDSFVRSSRQGTFLFLRAYMDYHRDRFTDHSLMFSLNGRLLAVLPANVQGDTLWSHEGLTYGGLLTSDHATATDVIDMFRAMNDSLKAEGLRRVVYKPMPWIYQRQPSEEDLYALTAECGARLVARSISSTIALGHPVKMRRDRRYKANKAKAEGLVVVRGNDYAPRFWPILDDNLLTAHHTHPVHTLEEMERLMAAFPENIRLYTALSEDRVVAGVVFYITPQVVHAQYISASPEGKEKHGLDLIFRQAMADFASYPYLDFGISTEHHGHQLNRGLIFQKEGFGGRAVCYDWYEYIITHHLKP